MAKTTEMMAAINATGASCSRLDKALIDSPIGRIPRRTKWVAVAKRM